MEHLENEVIVHIDRPEYKNFIRRTILALAPRFFEVASSTKYHHNYPGGQYQHSLEVLNICIQLWPLYTHLEKDLLYTAGFLHDVGKTFHYIETDKGIKHADGSKTLGHFGEGMRLLDKVYLSRPEIPPEEYELIIHCLVSHHGPPSNGWGSMVEPQNDYAWIVHLADMISAKAQTPNEKQYKKDYEKILKEGRINVFQPNSTQCGPSR
jgi:3'-5' exoribonuclease